MHMSQNIKKFLLSGFVVFVFFGYALHDQLARLVGKDDDVNVVAPKSLGTTSTPQESTQASALPSPTPTTTSKAKFKDGSYKGDLVDAYYGNVQVQAIIIGGKITDVKFLAYPNDRHTSVEINTQAMPYLTAEAIQAQDAQVDVISGATQTSLGFVKSLKSALAKAKI